METVPPLVPPLQWQWLIKLYVCRQIARCGYGGDHKIPITPNGGIAKLDTRMTGGITKIPQPNSDRFCSPPLPLFRLCPLGCFTTTKFWSWTFCFSPYLTTDPNISKKNCVIYPRDQLWEKAEEWIPKCCSGETPYCRCTNRQYYQL